MSSGFGTLDIEARHAMAFLRITKARVAALESLITEGLFKYFIFLNKVNDVVIRTNASSINDDIFCFAHKF